MTDPSGQTVILLRTYPDAQVDIAEQARACVEYVSGHNLPPYVGPLVEESLTPDKSLWLSRIGEQTWGYCAPGNHLVIYSLDTLTRVKTHRRKAIDKILASGARLHILTPIETEINKDVRAGMELEATGARWQKMDKKWSWGYRIAKVRRNNMTYDVVFERGMEMQIARQIVGRIQLGASREDILLWVKRKTKKMTFHSCRWRGLDWNHPRVARVVRDVAGADSDVYKTWMSYKQRGDQCLTTK